MTYITPTESGGQTAPPAPPAPPTGFFRRLFDIQFRGFVTPMVVSVLYVLGMVVIGFAYLAYVVTGFALDPAAGLLVMVVIGPVVGLFLLLFLRLMLEFYVAVTRLADDFREWRVEWHRREASS